MSSFWEGLLPGAMFVFGSVPYAFPIGDTYCPLSLFRVGKTSDDFVHMPELALHAPATDLNRVTDGIQ